MDTGRGTGRLELHGGFAAAAGRALAEQEPLGAPPVGGAGSLTGMVLAGLAGRWGEGLARHHHRRGELLLGARELAARAAAVDRGFGSWPG